MAFIEMSLSFFLIICLINITSVLNIYNTLIVIYLISLFGGIPVRTPLRLSDVKHDSCMDG